MRAVPVWWMVVAAAALLAGPYVAAAYAEPIPVAAIADGADGFTLGGVRTIAIHDISDGTYALMASQSIVQIVDITQPAEPRPVTVIPYEVDGSPSPYRPDDIAIHDISNRTYALVVRDGIVQIVDITQPAEPRPVTVMSYDAGGFTAMHQPKAVDAYDISNRTYAVVGSRGGVQVVDITRPDNPAPVATVFDDDNRFRQWTSVNDVTIHETAGRTYAFVITTSPGVCGLTCTDFHGLHVIDITSPADPLPVSPVHVRVVDDGIAIHDISNRTYAFLTGSTGSLVHIADITRPADTVPVSTISDDAGGFAELGGAHGIAIHDISNRTYAVVASWFDSGVQIMDVTRPDNPVPVAAMNDDTGGFTMLGGAYAVAVHSISNRTYAVVGGSEGVQIIDITHPISASTTTVLTACHIPAAARTAYLRHGGLEMVDDIAIHDISNRTYAVVAAGSRVEISDITSPADPVRVAVINDDTGGFTRLFRAEDVAVQDISNRTYAVVGGAFGDGMQIVDITNPADPVLVAAMFDEGSYAHGVALQAAHPVAALAGGAGGFTELDGADDIAIHEIANRTYAVVASAGDDGVQIIDITNPAAPLPAAALSDAGGFIELDGGGGVAVAKTHGRTYAVATGSFDDSVMIIDMTDPASPVPVPLASIAASTGGFSGLNWASDVALTQISGRTYAVVTGSFDDGVQVIDMTDPESPVPVTTIATEPGAFPGPGGVNYVGIINISGKTYAVAAGSFDDNVMIINMTDPESPVPVQAASTNIDPAWFSGPGVAVDMAITQISGRTYVVATSTFDEENVQIIDITDLESPAQIYYSALRFDGFAEISWANGTDTTQMSGRTYAVATGSPDDGYVHITDITNPEHAIPVASITAGPGWFAEPGGTGGVTFTQISGRTYAVAAGSIEDDVYIIDITDPASPAPAVSIAASPGGLTELAGARGIAVHDIDDRTYAVVASAGDDGVQIIDITNPADPAPAAAVRDDVGGFAELGGASGVAIRDIDDRTYAVVASAGDDGVQIIDITNLADPAPAAAVRDDVGGFTKLTGATDVAIHDIANRTYAVVTGYEGVQIIDITNPADPLPAAWLGGGPVAAIHDVSGRAHLLVSHSYDAVHIVDIAHPSAAGCLYN